ncbi:MAG: nickel-dependent hydrogenase large subunit [Candidatus Sedimenticola sp. 20ELBAFRAG]
MTRRVVGPFNRVEGDLEVQLEIEQGSIRDARVVSPMYRGFENMLHGRDPRDALVYTPRICGICSVSQSVAAARAIADAQGIAPPPNGEYATSLVLANENVADHLTHFYMFFMPDFARDAYRGEPWFNETAARFKAVKGSASAEMLPSRTEFLHLMGLLAGKWPHSLAIQPGGTTRAIEVQEKHRILTILYSFRRFLEKNLFGDRLERIAELDSAQALDSWRDEGAVESSDFRHFLAIAEALQLDTLGRASDRFMSYGAYEQPEGHLFQKGLWHGATASLDPDKIAEDVSHSWMMPGDGAKHPWDGVTQPDMAIEEGYSWCKAPRLDGEVVEVGAVARQVVDGHPLIRDLVAQSGGNVRNRVIARLLEIARVTIAMEQWAGKLIPREPFCNQAPIPDEARGSGMVEAARGSLGHWVRIKKGRILNYQIIAPTTWNFSPRDSEGVPGALEQALTGTPVAEEEKNPLSVQHIVRSFDPCMVCTVH